MKLKPFTSVVIAHHNGKNLIQTCLDALFKIDYPKDRMEIIVVDNRSEDDSIKFVKKKYPRVKIIANNVNSYCRACNLGILASRGSYIALLNNDVTVRKTWLSALIRVIEKDRAIGAVTCKLINKNGTIQNAGHYELPNFYWDERGSGRPPQEYSTISQVDSISGACVLYRKEALDKVGLLDEDFVMFGEDVDMSIRLRQQDWKLIYVPSSIGSHQVHGSCSESFVREAIEKNRLLLVAKHHPFQLANALIGSGYFVAGQDKLESGRIFDVLPAVLLKLAKHQDREVLKRVTAEVLTELKRILNYENKKLEENLKNILADLVETRKNRDHYKLDTQHAQETIAEREKYIEELSGQLSEAKNQLQENLTQLHRLQQELTHYKEETSTLTHKLQETLDASLVKDSSLLERQQRIDELSRQLAEAGNKLKETLDSNSAKDAVINEKEERLQDLVSQVDNLNRQLNHHKEDVAALMQKLQESLYSGLDKDANLLAKERQIQETCSQLNNLQEDLTHYKDEVAILTHKLQETLDASLVKDSSLLERQQRIDELSRQLAEAGNKLKETLNSNSAKDAVINEKEERIQTILKQTDDLNNQLYLLQQELTHYKEEISILTHKLQETLDASLVKDSSLLERQQRIDELSRQLAELNQQLRQHQEEFNNLSNKLKETLDSNSAKDAVINEKEERIQTILKQTDDLNNQLYLLQQELTHYKEEISILTHRLQESLDSGLSKDSVLLEKENQIRELSGQIRNFQQELSDYKEEVSSLSSKLKESLDKGLFKDSVINEKTRLLELAEDRLKEAEKELAGIYQSRGFRFVLKPLWKMIWYPRIFLRRLSKYIFNFLWIGLIAALTPAMLIQLLLFAGEATLAAFLGRLFAHFKKERKVVPFHELSVSVVIPNWNGIDLLKQCLASIYEISEFREGKYEVLVVDDASKYNIAKCIKGEFPKVRVIRNFFNRGFGRSCNRGVRKAKGELIVLLNNDIMVSRDFLAPLKEHFKNEDVFAVAPKLYYWDKKTFNYGMHMGRFEGGYLSLWNEAETGNGDKVTQTAPTIFAVGGAMVLRKRDFLWLGGFDDIYRPNCWEDIDISYRAQKRGLRVLYEPKSIVYHKGASTLNYLRHKEIKNELLFMWKNLNDRRLLLSHIIRLPKFLYRGRHSSRLTFLIGYLWAFDHIIWALAHKFKERRYVRVSDKKILNRCMLYYRNLARNNYLPRAKKTVLLITPFMLYPLTSGGKLRIYNLYQRLSQEFDLILLSLIHNEEERKYQDQLKGVFKEVHLIHPKTPSNEFLFPRRYKYSFSQLFIEELKAIQRKNALDIVHIESNELLYLTRYIKYIPIIYTEHDISILSFFNSYYKKTSHNPLAGFIDYLKIVRHHRSLYDNIDKVITLSRNDYRYVKAFAKFADVSLVPTGVDLGHFTFAQKTGKGKNLIFVGHYPHYPNEEAAVYFAQRIFPIVKRAVPEVKLRLVGSDPSPAVLKLANIEGVEVTGTVADVHPHLQEASVFVNAFQRSAGIKGKVLEAMATGTPVVCTRLGAGGIDAINSESIFIADKPKEFARRIIELLKNDELYRKTASHARALVEQKYDWDKIAGQLSRIYQNITASQPEPALPLEPTPPASPPAPAHSSAKGSAAVENIIAKVDKIVELSLQQYNRDNNSTAQRQGPQELHLELTHLCNSKCITCDIWDYHQRNNKTINDELSFENIKQLLKKSSEQIKNIKTVVLSGGEPFLRADLVEICSLIGDVLPSAAVGILTNATNTETVISKTKAILTTSKIKSLWIGSSLDGIGEAYDRMRGLSGGFERFSKTVRSFKKEFPGISFSVTFVLTPFNLDQLLPCWEFAEEHGLDFFAQFGVPKPARSPEVFKWRQEDYARIEGQIKEIIARMIAKDKGLEDFDNSLNTVSDKINLLTRIYYWAHLVDFQRTAKRFHHDCNAGFEFAMFDAYGNMFFCPLLKDKTIGNIKEKELDCLWASEEAKNIRGFIGSGKCSCWLVCTVFPIVGQALSLYGDKAGLKSQVRQALNLHMDRVDNFLDRKDLLGSISHDFRLNIELNNEEYKEGKSTLQSTPQGLTLGTNYGCNADCLFCLGGQYKPFSLNLYKDYFQPRLGPVLTRCGYVSFCGMGELLLVPEIEKFLNHINDKLADKNKILTTNGLALNNRILDRITKSQYSLQISLHASNPALHEYLTGIKGGFEKVIGQIRLAVSKRKDRQSPYLTLVFVANTINIEDLPDFMDLAASLGVDCVQCNYLTIFKPSHIKLSCFFKQEITNQMFDLALEKSRASKVALVLPPRFCADKYSRSTCSDPWKNIYVDTEGAVLPCCYSGDHFGELNSEDILAVWNNEKFKKIRQDLASGNPLAMCRYCLNSRQDNVNILNSHVSFRPEVQKTILEQD